LTYIFAGANGNAISQYKNNRGWERFWLLSDGVPVAFLSLVLSRQLQ